MSTSFEVNLKKEKLAGKDSNKNKIIRAIFSDYDGTLCSASAARDISRGQNRIPPEIKEALQQISKQIPVCVISSKDFFFLKETRSFAKVISCLMGIETLSFAHIAANQLSPPSHRKLLVKESKLSAKSEALEKIAKHIESDPEFGSISVERKYTFDGQILAGITVDWRCTNNWDYYKKGVQHTVSAAVTNLSHPPVPVHLFFQGYDFHPFVDVYGIRCDKGIGFDLVISEISSAARDSEVNNKKSCRITAEDVLYLGDSENDNPAFRKAGVSVGVRSDIRLNPRLECQYIIDFNNLGRFLSKLKDNRLIFRKELMNN